MPFGEYKDFADCVKINTKKGIKDPEGYCATIERKIKEAQNKKGEHKMTDKSPSTEGMQISVFTDDKVSKLKTLVDKLAKADSLETAKLLVIEFESFVNEVQVKPVEASTSEAPKVEEPVKVEEVKVEETPKVEAVKEAIAEPQPTVQATAATAPAPEEVSMKTQLSDALKLNEKMLANLKEAQQTIFTLEGVNAKYKEDVSKLQSSLAEKESSLFAYQQKEVNEAKERHNQKLQSVFTKYCDFMGIADSDKESIRNQMSTYSEDMLDKTMKYIDTKSNAKLESEPATMTKPSSELSGESTVMTREEYNKLSAKEKTQYLYGLMSKTKK